MKLGLREANQRFSKAIKAVRAGKDVILTERGRPIAVIKPIEGAHDPKRVLEHMASEGLISLPSRKGRLPRFEPIRVKGKSLARTIIEGRDDPR
jgi:prevent-host-death family protein